jgi:hypothetical protein
LHPHVELHNENLVLGAQHLVQKAEAGAAFFHQNLLLAHAGIHHQAEGERQIGLAREVADFLGMAVFGELEVLFGEAVDDFAVAASNRGEQVHHLYIGRKSRGLLVLLWGGARLPAAQEQRAGGQTQPAPVEFHRKSGNGRQRIEDACRRATVTASQANGKRIQSSPRPKLLGPTP